MVVRNAVSYGPIFWIPPNSTPTYKITVESGGVEEDITDLTFSFRIKDICTEGVGDFEFDIDNSQETYTNKWTGNEIFRYYKDYASTATTLRFRGRLEQISKKNFMLNCKGRAESAVFLTTNVTAQYTGTETSVILKDIISTYASGYTTTNVETGTTNLTINWYDKPFWDCVVDLCNASGFECWVSPDLDFYYFQSGTHNNTTEAIVHDMNMLEMGDFTPDITIVRNKITIYGAVQEGIQLIHTAQDTDSINSYGEKEEIINDDNVTSYEQAVDVANYELSIKKDPPIVGDVTSMLLSDVKPGENVQISNPVDGLDPGYYFCPSYEGVSNADGKITTKLSINKETRKITHVIKDRIEQENKNSGSEANPYQMRYSYDFLFNEESGTLTDTAIANGVLYATSANGTWVSETRSETGNITDCYLVLDTNDYNNVIVQVSGNGLDYENISNKSLITLSTSAGAELSIKVTIANTTAQINALSIQYNKQ
jgi:hypothetical protein